MCPALRGLWDWWWWRCDITRVCQVHDTCCHLACSGPDGGYFYDVPHSWPRGTGHLLQSSWLEFVTETTEEGFLNTGFEYICRVLRLCAQNTLTVLLFTCNSPKTVIFLKPVSPVLVSHREPGPVTHDHQLKIQKSVFSTPQSSKLWPVCSCLSVLKYSTIQFKTVHDNESSYRITQTQAVINSPVITPCRISWKHMLITIDPKTTRFMSSQLIITAK